MRLDNPHSIDLNQSMLASAVADIRRDSPNFDSSVRTVLFRSLSWTSAARGAAIVGVLLRYVIFARLLRPFDFGVLNSAASCLILAMALTDPNFDSALVARHDEITPYLDTVWVTMVAQGALVALALIALAWPLSFFFKIPEVYRVFWAVAPLALIKSLRSPASGSRIYRKMDFRISFMLTTGEQVAGFLIGLGAILWFGDWRGLICAMYAESLARSASTYWYFPYWPRFRFNPARFRSLFGYSKWVTIRGFIDRVSQNVANIAVGHLLGAKALGEYQMAFRLGEMPGTELGAVAGLVSFPLVSRIGNERAQRRRLYGWTSGTVATVGIIYALFLLQFGPLVIARTIGTKWLGAVPALRLLCFYGVAQGLIIVGAHFLDGLGKPDTSFRIASVTTVVLTLLIYPFTSWFGLIGAAAAVVTSVAIPVPIVLMLCREATRKAE
jgi:O-antigen/teichoic acid export membrane protein